MKDLDDIKHHPIFRKLCREATNAASRFQMLAEGDRVLVGISGGEDSLTLMHVLTYLQHRAPFHFEVLAATVDMDFASFRIEELAEYCRHFGWNWRSVRLPGQQLLQEKGAEARPCALCSRLRRGQLHKLADELGCNKIALGQQLDDLCVSLLMALFRGGGLKTMGANVMADSGSKRLIRPLCTSRKAQIHELGQFLEYPSIRSCPYEERLKEDGDRAYLEQLLGDLERHFRFVKEAMLRSMSDVRLEHLLDIRYLGQTEDPDRGKL